MRNLQIPSWMEPPIFDIRKSDVVTVDRTSPAATDVNGFSIQLGVATSGELNGDTAHPYHPSGLYCPPVQSTQGQNGTEALYVFRNDEGFYLGCRDTVNQLKAGTVYPGEFCAYSPGATGSNKILIDLYGNIIQSAQVSISQTVAASNIIYMDTNKYQMVHKYGNITVDNSGITLANANGSAGIQITQTGQINIFGTIVNIHGSMASFAGDVGTFLGKAPSITNTALYGPAGVAGVPSTNVFIST